MYKYRYWYRILVLISHIDCYDSNFPKNINIEGDIKWISQAHCDYELFNWKIVSYVIMYLLSLYIKKIDENLTSLIIVNSHSNKEWRSIVCISNNSINIEQKWALFLMMKKITMSYTYAPPNWLIAGSNWVSFQWAACHVQAFICVCFVFCFFPNANHV